MLGRTPHPLLRAHTYTAVYLVAKGSLASGHFLANRVQAQQGARTTVVSKEIWLDP